MPVKKPVKVPDVDFVAEVKAAAKALAPAVKRLTSTLNKVKIDKLPFGTAADLLYQLHAVAKLVPNLAGPFNDVLTPKIKELEEHFIAKLAEGEASGVQGHMSRVQITSSLVPTVKDWSKLYAYIAKTKSFELLNKAPNTTAMRERWDAKKQVPGVEAFRAKRVSCTKLGGK